MFGSWVSEAKANRRTIIKNSKSRRAMIKNSKSDACGVAQVHISEVCKAFRLEYSKYRTSEQLSDDRLKNYFRAFIRPRTGQKGKQGFFKGVALVAKTSAFGDDAAKVQWKRKEETLRELEILSAQRDAEVGGWGWFLGVWIIHSQHSATCCNILQHTVTYMHSEREAYIYRTESVFVCNCV